MDLNAGGHLSHGASANFSGKWFKVVNYGVGAGSGLIDHDQIADLARRHQPKLVIAGGSAYPRALEARVGASVGEIAARFPTYR
jgi:glycine hydroxymethyltransferase